MDHLWLFSSLYFARHQWRFSSVSVIPYKYAAITQAELLFFTFPDLYIFSACHEFSFEFFSCGNPRCKFPSPSTRGLLYIARKISYADCNDKVWLRVQELLPSSNQLLIGIFMNFIARNLCHCRFLRSPNITIFPSSSLVHPHKDPRIMFFLKDWSKPTPSLGSHVNHNPESCILLKKIRDVLDLSVRDL